MNMNIAASNAIQPPTQGRTDLPASTGTAQDATADGGDATTVANGDSRNFGRILSGNMKAGGDAQANADGDGRKVDTATTVASDAADAATEQRLPVDLGAVLQGKTDPSKPDATDASKASKTGDDKKDDATDAVSSDVAAQLVLATQWAAAAPTHPTPQTDATTGDDKSALKAKVDDRGATNGRIAAARTALTTADVAQVQAAAIPVALNAAAFSVDRNARSLATAAVATIGKSDGLKEEATKLATPESKTVSIDKLFNLAATSTSTSTDPSTIANQFVSQVTAQVSSAQNSITATSTTGAMALHESVGTPGWSHELGQAAVRMATNDLQNASIRLNPEHLGPLDVQLRIDNGVAHMQFMAAHADTRHALESSRATLDQMFGDQGIKLGDWSVGQSSSNGSFARSFGTASSQGDGNGQATGNGDADTTITTVAVRTNRPLGLVDTFA